MTTKKQDKNSTTVVHNNTALNAAIAGFVGTKLDNTDRRAMMLRLGGTLYSHGEALKPYGLDGKVVVSDIAEGDEGTKLVTLTVQGQKAVVPVPRNSEAHFEAASRLRCRGIDPGKHTALVNDTAKRMGLTPREAQPKAEKPTKKGHDEDVF